MFWRKAKLIKSLEENMGVAEKLIFQKDQNLEVLRKTLAGVKEESSGREAALAVARQAHKAEVEALQAELEALQEVSHAKDGKLIEMAGQVKQAEFELTAAKNELEITNDVLSKAQEKIQGLEDELRTKAQEAQREAQRVGSLELSDLDSHVSSSRPWRE